MQALPAMPFPDFDYGGYVLSFGKHRGKTLREIDKGGDRRYLEWMVKQPGGRDVTDALRFYLEGTG